MKRIIIIGFGLLLSQSTFAQFKQLGASETFAEPESGSAILLKGKNGNTFFLHFEKKGNLDIKFYSNQRQLLFEKSYDYLVKREKAGDIISSFVANEKIIIFTTIFENKTPILQRLIIDCNTGQEISKEEIARFRKMHLADGYAFAFGNVPLPSFYVRKSTESDDYAIALFNTLAEDRNERIEIMHFDEHNKLINKAFYQSPNDGYKYMIFRDLYIDNNKSVYVVSTGFNTAKSGGDQSGGLFVGKLNNNAQNFDMKKLPFSQAAKIEGVILRYNPISEQFLMLSNKFTGNKKNEQTYLVTLSTFDKSLENFENRNLNFAALNRIAKTAYKKKEKLNAIPKTLIINRDGSYVIPLEETLVKVTQSMSSNGSFSTSRHSYFLNDVGIVKYTKDHQETATQYLPKSQVVNGIPDIMHYSFREEKPADLGWGVQYKSFQYLDAPNSNYILINDIESNIIKTQEKKNIKRISGVGDCEGYYYKVSNNELPKGERLNSDKTGKNKTLLLFAVAHYDNIKNEYTIMETSAGKKSRIVWLQPE